MGARVWRVCRVVAVCGGCCVWLGVVGVNPYHHHITSSSYQHHHHNHHIIIIPSPPIQSITTITSYMYPRVFFRF